MESNPEPAAGVAKKLRPAELFAGFFQAGILGFGGVLPIARRMLVEQRKWLSGSAFNDLFSLCQFMPGANIVNLTFAFGFRNGGLTGVAAALAGLFSAPIVIVLCLAALYTRYGGIPIVQHGLNGLAAAGAGLVLGTAMKIAAPACKGLRPIFIVGLTLVLVVLAHFSLPSTILIALPLSVALAWRADGKGPAG
jgi:chromate transporter